MKIPVNRPGKVPPPESISWYWHPSRAGVRGGPPLIEKKLAEIDPNLAITWNAYTEEWQIWLKKPQLQHKLCWGWLLLFTVAPENLGEGERVIARLYSASARMWGGGKHYFDAIQREEERDKQKAEQAEQQDSFDRGWDMMQHYRPSVGYGPSNGSKTARFD